MAVFFFLLFNFLFLVPFDANTRWKPFLLTLSHTYLASLLRYPPRVVPSRGKPTFAARALSLQSLASLVGSGKNSRVPSRRRGYFSFVNEIKTIVGCTWPNPHKQADPCLW